MQLAHLLRCMIKTLPLQIIVGFPRHILIQTGNGSKSCRIRGWINFVRDYCLSLVNPPSNFAAELFATLCRRSRSYDQHRIRTIQLAGRFRIARSTVITYTPKSNGVFHMPGRFSVRGAIENDRLELTLMIPAMSIWHDIEQSMANTR